MIIERATKERDEKREKKIKSEEKREERKNKKKAKVDKKAKDELIKEQKTKKLICGCRSACGTNHKCPCFLQINKSLNIRIL